MEAPSQKRRCGCSCTVLGGGGVPLFFIFGFLVFCPPSAAPRGFAPRGFACVKACADKLGGLCRRGAFRPPPPAAYHLSGNPLSGDSADSAACLALRRARLVSRFSISLQIPGSIRPDTIPDRMSSSGIILSISSSLVFSFTAGQFREGSSRNPRPCRLPDSA